MRDMDPSQAVAPQHIPAALQAHFEIVQSWPRGGTLLAPIFGSGCLDSAIAADAEGAKVLAAMFRAEHDLMRAGALPCDNYLYVARARPQADGLVRAAFETNAAAHFRAGRLGIKGDLDAWTQFNETGAFQSVVARDAIAPFPPADLMHRTSALRADQAFAALFNKAIEHDWFSEAEELGRQYLTSDPDGPVKPLAQIILTMGRAQAGQFCQAAEHFFQRQVFGQAAEQRQNLPFPDQVSVPAA